MITYHPFETLGKANHGWLKANHHFSFGGYYNPKRMGFGTLRVINDDWIESGKGFAPHPHDNMEIITYVRTGSISHQDNAGNKGVTQNGEVQVMSAGSGIIHSEHNLSGNDLTLYQIWIETNERDVSPRWDSKTFPTTPVEKDLPLLVSGYPEDKGHALFIHQNARIFGGKVLEGAQFEHPITHQAYVLASSGQFKLDDNSNSCVLQKGDGAEVTNKSVTITALTDCEIVVIDAPLH